VIRSPSYAAISIHNAIHDGIQIRLFSLWEPIEFFYSLNPKQSKPFGSSAGGEQPKFKAVIQRGDEFGGQA
jgi:hypothetical protein